MQVAIATGIPAGAWLEDPRALITAVDILNEQKG